MIISVASGKGGTGKTTVSASLASIWDRPVVAVDLDVEEPNLHLFLRPAIETVTPVRMEIPELDTAKCTYCRKCSELCAFRAISVAGQAILTFPEMCHGCGGCLAVCPEGALTPGHRDLGVMEEGRASGTPFLMGRLRIGEAMSPPLMRAVKKRLAEILASSNGGDAPDAILDAPPGVSCPAMAAVADSDFIVLVTEPTPFGFHDFKLAWEAFAPQGTPMGAVINRAGIGDRSVQEFCRDKGIPVLAEIPYSREAAEGYSRGRVIADLNSELRASFTALREAIRAHAKTGAAHD